MTGVLRLLGLATPLGLLVACGPVTYVRRVSLGESSASSGVAQAKVGNAEKMAPYEYTRATQYLYQAKMLAGYARFQDSNRFGELAQEAAVKSRQVAARREKNDELPVHVPGKTFITPDGQIRTTPTAAPTSSDGLSNKEHERPTLEGTEKGGAR